MITTTVSDLIAPISVFKRELEGISALQGSAEATVRLRTWIRRHRFNRLIAPE